MENLKNEKEALTFEKPKTIDELLKGGLKKGEFVEVFSYSAKGTSLLVNQK